MNVSHDFAQIEIKCTYSGLKDTKMKGGSSNFRLFMQEQSSEFDSNALSYY